MSQLFHYDDDFGLDGVVGVDVGVDGDFVVDDGVDVDGDNDDACNDKEGAITSSVRVTSAPLSKSSLN